MRKYHRRLTQAEVDDLIAEVQLVNSPDKVLGRLSKSPFFYMKLYVYPHFRGDRLNAAQENFVKDLVCVIVTEMAHGEIVAQFYSDRELAKSSMRWFAYLQKEDARAFSEFEKAQEVAQ